MRAIKCLFFIALVLTMVFCSAQAVLAYGSSSGDQSSLTTYPNAPGTKYEGPLTLYYTIKTEYVVPDVPYSTDVTNVACKVTDDNKCVLYNKDNENVIQRNCAVINSMCLVQKVTHEMNIFLRLRKGMTGWAFSGITPIIDVNDVKEQQDKVEDFINEKVIPLIYQCTPGGCPPVLIKSVNNITADDALLSYDGINCCDGLHFFILDVVIAVQD